MALDHQVYYSTHGKYNLMPDLPVIPHPIIPLMGNLFYVLSFRAEADGTREGDWYLVNNQGRRPVCSCPAYTAAEGCKHCREMQRQEAALIPATDALLAADRAARRADRIAREEGRVAA